MDLIIIDDYSSLFDRPKLTELERIRFDAVWDKLVETAKEHKIKFHVDKGAEV